MVYNGVTKINHSLYISPVLRANSRSNNGQAMRGFSASAETMYTIAEHVFLATKNAYVWSTFTVALPKEQRWT